MFGLSLAIFSSPLGEKGKKCATEDGMWGGKGQLPGRLDAEDLPNLSSSGWHFLLGLLWYRAAASFSNLAKLGIRLLSA